MEMYHQLSLNAALSFVQMIKKKQKNTAIQINICSEGEIQSLCMSPSFKGSYSSL